jgi:acyl dehydratase
VTGLNIKQLRVGDTLPEFGIDISAKLIVAAAIASRDYQNVHHDKAAAQSLGSPDIFMNILTSNGLVGRYIGDWAGVGATLKKIAIRLGAPNYPGDHMTLSGELIAVDIENSLLEIAVRGANSLGDHLTGSVTVALPVG